MSREFAPLAARTQPRCEKITQKISPNNHVAKIKQNQQLSGPVV